MLNNALRQHWTLAWPLILANAATPLLGLADTAIAGHLPEPKHLAAVVVGAELITLVFWSCGFLRMGTTGLIAQASGRSIPSEIISIVANALTLAVVLGLTLIGIWWALESRIIAIANPEPAIAVELLDYLRIRIWTAPIVLATYVCSAYFIGQGMTRIALGLALGINLINIIANYILAIEFQMDTRGIALGTAFAECCGLLCALGLILKQQWTRQLWDQMHIRAVTIWHMLTLNLPLFLRTLILKGVFVMLTLHAASLGVTEAAALGLLLILLSTAAYALDGFAFASEIETGQSIGRQDRRRLYLSLWAGAIATALATIGIIVLYHFLAAELIAQLTIHEVVAIRATALLPWLYGILAVLAGSYWLDGVFIGLLRPTAMFVSMLLAGITWILGLWLFGTDRLDVLLAAFVLFGVVRTISLGAQLPRAITQSMR